MYNSVIKMLKLGHQLLSVPEIPTIFLNTESLTMPVISSALRDWGRGST